MSASGAVTSFINAHNYGAKGDGTTDDTAALNAALAAVSPALGVMEVRIPDGTYMVNGVNTSIASHRDRWENAGLRPKAGTRITMTPGAVLSVIPNNSPSYSVVYLGQACDNIVIAGGTIQGDRATHDYTSDTSYPTHEWGFGISMQGARNVTIDGVTIKGCTGDCIIMGSPGMIGVAGAPYMPEERVVVRNCVLDGARRNNISLTATDHVLIENNLITNAGTSDGVHDGTAPRFGIDIEGYGEGSTDYEIPYRVTVRGNRFVGNQAGAVMDYDGYRTVITGNFSDGVISFGYATEATITNNVMVNTSDTTSSAIASNSFSTGEYAANSLIAGNIVEGFGTGIQVQRDNVLVTGNLVSSFASLGIGTSTTANGVTISGNRITDGAGSAAIGISVNAGPITVDGNSIYNTFTGVSVGTSATGVVISDNTITQGAKAVVVASGAQATIKGNVTNLPGHASGQSYDVSWNSTSVVLCEGNIFRNSSTYPISASNNNGTSRIIGNRFVDTAAAIYLTGPGRFEVIGNTFILKQATGSNYYPILFAGASAKSLIMGNTGYNSGAVPYSFLVNLQTGQGVNTKVIGNTLVTASGSGSLVTGTDGGTLTETGSVNVTA